MATETTGPARGVVPPGDVAVVAGLLTEDAGGEGGRKSFPRGTRDRGGTTEGAELITATLTTHASPLIMVRPQDHRGTDPRTWGDNPFTRAVPRVEPRSLPDARYF